MAALLINAAILIVAASFHRAGYTEVGEIKDAYRLLVPVLGGGLASLLLESLCWRRDRCRRLRGPWLARSSWKGF
jgi:Mn2+/Fe2+ NRAMP family transporter